MQKIAFMTPEEIEDLFIKSLSRYFSGQNPQPKSESPPKPEGERYLISIKELGNFLNCSVVTAQKLKNSGRIRYRQFGRKVIFSKAEILEDLRNTGKGRKKIL